METDKVEAILREHVRLCSDLHGLFLEEGKIMRATGSPPDEAFLEKKKHFLPVLGKGLELLQRINENPDSFPRGVEPLVKEARSLIMKLMMLDRENERLLLKTSLPPKMKEAYGQAAPGQVAKAYAKYNK
jgi:hypothetical protein